jgi:uncharacterized protein YndB with AHSA1/START domain
MSSIEQNDPTSIRVDQFLPHPPAQVWRALTEPELIAQWLMPGDFRLEIGHRYTMQARPVAATEFSGAIRAEVLAFEVEKLLRIGWQDAAPVNGAGVDWTITWTLQPEGRGTRLFLLHEGFDPDNPVQQRARTIMNGGWRTGVPRALAKLLARI